MTEEQIENRVEKMIDRLDRAYLRGDFDDEEYRQRMNEIRAWADGLALTQNSSKNQYRRKGLSHAILKTLLES